MTTEQLDRAVVSPGPVPAAPPAVPLATRATTPGAGAAEMTRRILVLVFGLIQLVIGLRIVLLLLDARTGNALVAAILNVSQIFVAPFEGILHTNALAAGGAVLDIAAIVAFIGWTIIELVVNWAIDIFRRQAA
jgi:hypothetical protein